jgi:hypothetical protein
MQTIIAIHTFTSCAKANACAARAMKARDNVAVSIERDRSVTLRYVVVIRTV